MLRATSRLLLSWHYDVGGKCLFGKTSSTLVPLNAAYTLDARDVVHDRSAAMAPHGAEHVVYASSMHA